MLINTAWICLLIINRLGTKKEGDPKVNDVTLLHIFYFLYSPNEMRSIAEYIKLHIPSSMMPATHSVRLMRL